MYADAEFTGLGDPGRLHWITEFTRLVLRRIWLAPISKATSPLSGLASRRQALALTLRWHGRKTVVPVVSQYAGGGGGGGGAGGRRWRRWRRRRWRWRRRRWRWRYSSGGGWWRRWRWRRWRSSNHLPDEFTIMNLRMGAAYLAANPSTSDGPMTVVNSGDLARTIGSAKTTCHTALQAHQSRHLQSGLRGDLAHRLSFVIVRKDGLPTRAVHQC